MARWDPKKNLWIATKQIQGNRRWFSGATEEEADAAAASWNPFPTPIFDEETFAGFVYGTWKANTWPELKPMSKVKYNGQLKNHILPVLGQVPIAEVCLDDMLALKNSLALKPKHRKGQKMGNRTVHDLLSLTLGIMLLAKKSGRTRREDWALIKLPKINKKTVREEPEQDFTQLLLKAAAGDWMAGPLFVALFLGLRRGETAGLKWSAIDRKRMAIRIDTQRQRQSGKGTVEASTKGAARILHVNEDILGWIDQLGNRSSVYVFTGAHGFPMRPDRITKAMERLCKDAGVGKVTYHDLRSFAASNLAAMNVPEVVIKSILGHVNLETTRLYIDARKESVRSALAGLLGESIGKTG